MLLEDTFKSDKCYAHEFRRLLDRSFHKRAEYSIRNLLLKCNREASIPCRTEPTQEQSGRGTLHVLQQPRYTDKPTGKYRTRTTKNSSKQLIRELAPDRLANTSNLNISMRAEQEGAASFSPVSPPLTALTKAQKFLARRSLRQKQVELSQIKNRTVVEEQLTQLGSNLKVSRKNLSQSHYRSLSKELISSPQIRSVPRYFLPHQQKENLHSLEQFGGWPSFTAEDNYEPF